MARPARERLGEQAVDLGLGADVDARPSAPRGSAACSPIRSQRAITTFCWLPPERVSIGRVGSLGRTPNRPHSTRACRRLVAGLPPVEQARLPLAAGLRNMFSRTLSGMARLSAVRSPATKPMPAPIAAPGVLRSGVAPRQRDAAGIDRGAARTGPGRPPPGRRRAGRRGPRISPGRKVRRDGPDVADPQPGEARSATPWPLVSGAHEHLLRRPADDQSHQLARRGRRAPARPTSRPSRSTATSSAISKTSSSRCET